MPMPREQAPEDDLTGDRPHFDFVMLADRAEVLKGKLYMMGGGWSQATMRSWNESLLMAIAMGILVPWNATNQDYRIRVWFEDADGGRVGPQMDAGFRTGRPPHLDPGTTQRVLIAINSSLKIPGKGEYRLVAELDTGERWATTFTAGPPRSSD